MRIELEKAGFSDIVHCQCGQSTHPELVLDSHEASRVLGTLCVEATRS